MGKKPKQPQLPPLYFPGGHTWVDDYSDQGESRAPRKSAAGDAIAALFPDGVPAPAVLPNKELVAKVAAYMKANSITVPSDKTIRRAAGRT